MQIKTKDKVNNFTNISGVFNLILKLLGKFLHSVEEHMCMFIHYFIILRVFFSDRTTLIEIYQFEVLHTIDKNIFS